MGVVVQTRCCVPVEEVVELFSGAVGPLESLLGVAKIAHDVTVLPTTSLRSGTLQVGRGSRTVVDRPQKMADLVGRHYDAGEAPSVLHNGHRVDLLQALVHHARAAHVREAGSASCTLCPRLYSAAHVQFGDSHCYVIGRQPPLLEEVLPHVCEGGG